MNYTIDENNCLIVEDGTEIVERGERDDFSNITSVKLPNTVKVIERKAFERCNKLKTVNFPEGLKEIGEKAFYRCEGLTEISIPGSVKVINFAAFANCVKLNSIEIADGLEKIGSYAFCSCSETESIKIPQSIRYIGEGSFLKCKSLNHIKIPSGFAIQEKLELMGINKNVYIDSDYSNKQDASGLTKRELSEFYDLLRASDNKLKKAITEIETMKEELRTTKEELRTTKEELRTTKEELRTTKEELRKVKKHLKIREEELQKANERIHLLEKVEGANKVILAIGNSNYIKKPLNAAAKDAVDICEGLKKYKYYTICVNDSDLEGMKKAIDEFYKIMELKHTKVGMIYFSGHGCVAKNKEGKREESIISVDMKPYFISDVVRADKELEGKNIYYIMDACRNIMGKDDDIEYNTVVMPKNRTLSYVTQYDNKAADGSKNGNGAYATQLLRLISFSPYMRETKASPLKLIGYTSELLNENNKQRPQIITGGENGKLSVLDTSSIIDKSIMSQLTFSLLSGSTGEHQKGFSAGK